MLHLERKAGEGIIIDYNGKVIRLIITPMNCIRAKVSFDNFVGIKVWREELYWKMQEEK